MDAGTGRKISIIVPVLDEGPLVNGLVDHLRGLSGGPRVQIILADSGPRAATLACLDRPGVVGLAAPRGRAAQMNAGAAAASGEFLLFLHADTRLPDGALAALCRVLDGGLARAGTFDLEYPDAPWSLRLLAAAARLRARLDRIPYGDRGVFVSAALFRAMGGFAPLPLMEDVDFFLRLKRAGEPVAILPLRARTSARRFLEEGVWRCGARNLALRLAFHLGADPARLKDFYPDHAASRDPAARAGGEPRPPEPRSPQP